MIKTTQPVCIFSEPQFAGVAIKTVVRGFDIEIGELDPLGVNSIAQQNRYAHFISQFAQQFIDCLGAQR
jgi:zinc transport system substrate-binding protein